MLSPLSNFSTSLTNVWQLYQAEKMWSGKIFFSKKRYKNIRDVGYTALSAFEYRISFENINLHYRENAEWDFLKVADEAFDLLDMDGNGTIERGDIE